MYAILKNDAVIFVGEHPIPDTSLEDDCLLVVMEYTTMGDCFEEVIRPVVYIQHIKKERSLRGLAELTGKALHVNDTLCKVIGSVVALYNNSLHILEDDLVIDNLRKTIKQWEYAKLEILLLSNTVEEFLELNTPFIHEAKHLRLELYNSVIGDK